MNPTTSPHKDRRKTLGIRAKFINETLISSFEGVIEAVADEYQKNWKGKIGHDQYLFWYLWPSSFEY